MGIKARMEKLPLYFIENRGQADDRVAFYIQSPKGIVYFTPTGVTFVLTGPDIKETSPGVPEVRAATWTPEQPMTDKRWIVKLDFVGANPSARPAGRDLTSAVVSYFKGPKEEWKTGLPTYGSVVYENLWPGIDLVYTGEEGRLKATYVVKPEADPGMIRLAYRGPEEVAVTEEGRLRVSTPLGGFEEERPYTYQEIGGKRLEVATTYSLQTGTDAGEFVYGFRVEGYDRSKALVIDPAILSYCGYIGGSGSDVGYGIAVDSSGNAYVTGYTGSTESDFSVTGGPDLTYNSGGTDAFVAKVNAAGTALVYCGYIGGSGSDYGRGIAVDSSGNAYVTGYTDSTESNFPVTGGPDLTYNGGTDAFVAKVNAAGTALVYCGYIGGSGDDRGYGIAVDSSGNAYVTGSTSSTESDFPVTGGPDLTHNGPAFGYDAFVAKVNAAGTALTYCGYIGGSGTDYGYGIAVDSAGNAYVTGYTSSTAATFPVTGGPDLTHNGSTDAFVAKVNSSGAALVYCGYIGGSSNDRGYGIAVDSSGNAYVTGYTSSTAATFPVTGGPDLTHNGSTDAFVAKVNSSGTALVYCGYIGGSGDDQGYGIAVDSAGNAYVTGYTYSTQTTFPVTGGPDLTHNGASFDYDAFVAKVNAAGTALIYCGYIGGSSTDYGYGIAVDSAGNAYVTGSTTSTETTFPVTSGPDLIHNGGTDAFVAKIVTSATISGTVFEDVNYGGGAGRNWATASGNGGSARSITRVELFDGSGAYVSATTTDGSGNYTFSGLNVGSYLVRVVTSSVTSSRTGYTASCLPVMTYRTDASSGTAVDVTDYVGGHDPATADAGNAASGWVLNSSTGAFSGSGSGKAHDFTPVMISSANVTGVDFGWNFDTIANTNGTGQGSLRQFITNANTLGGDASLAQSSLVAAKENAVFMISNGTAAAGLRTANNYFSGGVATISPTSALPTISSPLVIDGYTQPGASANTLAIGSNAVLVIVLDGINAGDTTPGFSIAAGATTVRGLVINNFTYAGIHLDSGDGNTIAGNYIGTNATGTIAVPNGRGTAYDGILIGYAAASSNNVFGGSTPADRNLISGNFGGGIWMAGSNGGNTIRGNYIGVNASGSAGLGNGQHGIILSGTYNTIIDNVISGNGQSNYYGIYAPSGAGNTTIQSNLVGVSADGTTAISNKHHGIYINSANNLVGGTTLGKGNVIANSSGKGVIVATTEAKGNAILRNSIYGNSNIGIDLGTNGVTANNGAKGSSLANWGMDHPVFSTAISERLRRLP